MTALDGFGADLKHHVCRVEVKRRSSPPIPIQHQTAKRLLLKSEPKTKAKPAKPTTYRPSIIYSILLYLILIVIKWAQLVRIYCLRVYYCGQELVDGWLMMKKSRSFSQAPSHVCVIINESLVYVDSGRLVDKLGLIIQLMSDNGTGMVTLYSPRPIDVELMKSLVNKFSNKFDSNGSKKLQIQFMTNPQTGRCLLVDACKSLASQVRSKTLNAKEISQDLVDKTIQDLSKMPEPELIVSVGEEDTLAGFSPWHTRLSEIIKIDSHMLINRRTIYQLLERYEKIEKRFGK